MRVATRAPSIASTVSERPGPVPGAGGNCPPSGPGARATNAMIAIPFTTTERLSLTLFSLPSFRGFLRLPRSLAVPRRLKRGTERPLLHGKGPPQEGQHAHHDLEQRPFPRGAGLPEKP